MDSLNKKVDLASGVGAGLLGFGLGALFAPYMKEVAIPVAALGLILHAWGMFAKHQIEQRNNIVIPTWSKTLYWLCWIALIALVVYAVFGFWMRENL